MEKLENGIPRELGRYYSFQDVVIARNEEFGEYKEDLDKLVFSVKIGKSYKNRGWSIIRDTTYDLIPKLPYEDDCDIIVDGIPTTAKLNLLPRIFYTRTDDVVGHLEELAKTNPDGRIDVQLLLNKDNPVFDSKIEIKELNNEIKELNDKVSDLNQDINELKEILDYMDDENRRILKKFDEANNVLDKINKMDIDDDEISVVPTLILRDMVSNILDHVESLNEILKN